MEGTNGYPLFVKVQMGVCEYLIRGNALLDWKNGIGRAGRTG